jgi:hypothetical protein
MNNEIGVEIDEEPSKSADIFDKLKVRKDRGKLE